MNHIEQSQYLIAKALHGAGNPVLWISGGKDSLSLAHLARGWSDRLRLLYVQSDDGWPGERENLEACAEAWGYMLNVLDVGVPWKEYVATYGWPVDVVPSAYDTAPLHVPSPYAAPGGLRFSSGPLCQHVRFAQPLVNASRMLGASVVLTGSRGEDGPLFASQGETVDGRPHGLPWVRYNPIIHWSHEQAYAYVDEHNIPLPPHYEWKREMGAAHHAVDCLSCMWYMDHWQILKAHYPEEYEKRWPEVKPIYAEYRRALAAEVDNLKLLED